MTVENANHWTLNIFKPLAFCSLTLYWFSLICYRYSMPFLFWRWKLKRYCLPTYFAKQCQSNISHYNRYGCKIRIANELKIYTDDNCAIIEEILCFMCSENEWRENIQCLDESLAEKYFHCKKYLKTSDVCYKYKPFMDLFAFGRKSNGKVMNIGTFFIQGMAVVYFGKYFLSKLFVVRENNGVFGRNILYGSEKRKYHSFIWFLSYCLIAKPMYDHVYNCSFASV